MSDELKMRRIQRLKDQAHNYCRVLTETACGLEAHNIRLDIVVEAVMDGNEKIYNRVRPEFKEKK